LRRAFPEAFAEEKPVCSTCGHLNTVHAASGCGMPGCRCMGPRRYTARPPGPPDPPRPKGDNPVG
jgi:hypothetical protein